MRTYPKGHSKGVSSAGFSHDSKVVASATDDSTVRIWSVETGECEHVVDIGLTQALYFTADDTGLVTDARVISLTDESITSAKPPIRPSSPSDLDLGINGNNSWFCLVTRNCFGYRLSVVVANLLFQGIVSSLVANQEEW